MKWILGLAALLAIACTNSNSKPEVNKEPLNHAMFGLVQFVNDSLAACETWLAKDYRIRRFFDDNDSIATRLTEKFDHDQILAWYQSMDTTSLLDYSAYLDSLESPYVPRVDSALSCASAINTVAFSHKGTEALLLLVDINGEVETTYSLLLEKASLLESWYVADTLWHQSTTRK